MRGRPNGGQSGADGSQDKNRAHCDVNVKSLIDLDREALYTHTHQTSWFASSQTQSKYYLVCSARIGRPRQILLCVCVCFGCGETTSVLPSNVSVGGFVRV